jgi:hypothetical protein
MNVLNFWRKKPMLYIDVPYDRKTNWSLGKDIERVLEIELNVNRVKFICNDLAKISKGDLYEVAFGNEDPLVFYLRTGLKPFPETQAIAAYRQQRRR